MDEKRFYDEKEETKQHALICPHCRQETSFPVRWMVRTKKAQCPGGSERRGQAAICEGAFLHGPHGQSGGLPQYQVPQAIRFDRAEVFLI